MAPEPERMKPLRKGAVIDQDSGLDFLDKPDIKYTNGKKPFEEPGSLEAYLKQHAGRLPKVPKIDH